MKKNPKKNILVFLGNPKNEDKILKLQSTNQ